MIGVQLRRYSLPNVQGEGWAIIVIGDDGYFSAVSDYGNHAFIWSHPGMEFRRFLTQLGPDYVAGKLSYGHDKQYQPEQTLENVKDHIIQSRRDGTWGKETARDEWDLLDRHSSLYSHFDFYDWMRDTKICDAYELARHDHPAEIRSFVRHTLPRFQAVLRAELLAEGEQELASWG